MDHTTFVTLGIDWRVFRRTRKCYDDSLLDDRLVSWF
jgi:hypothetical protein